MVYKSILLSRTSRIVSALLGRGSVGNRSAAVNLGLLTYRTLTDETTMQYEEAVRTLNLLQTGHRKPKFRDAACLVAMQQCLQRAQISQEDLKNLNIVHISGTKGKGSTSAFVESILRHHGYKTGFFSSPHLIEVRERIRINGTPISRTQFADYFEEVYGRFTKTSADYEFDYPSYFYFLTTMAFNVFKHERVDVAIMEVGIGGTFDCTNVVQSPVICGVTPLGHDHMDYLGDTIESIAWHKSGIFKPGAEAFTVPQPYSAMQVMAQSALDNEIRLQVCPDLSTYQLLPGRKFKLGLAGEHQRTNASLALQIAESWMKHQTQRNEVVEKQVYLSEVEAFPSPASSFVLTDTHIDALENCTWRGRAQVVRFNGLTFYLDGAHTVKSMECCSKWFIEETGKEERSLGAECTRILAFNITGERDAAAMFRILQDCDISQAIFTPNITTFVPSDSADQTNLKAPIEKQVLRAVRNHDEWVLMRQEQARKLHTKQAVSRGMMPQSSGDQLGDTAMTKAPIFATIADSLVWLSKDRDERLFKMSTELASAENYEIPSLLSSKHVQVLVTGSVHLVGGFLRILDPSID